MNLAATFVQPEVKPEARLVVRFGDTDRWYVRIGNLGMFLTLGELDDLTDSLVDVASEIQRRQNEAAA